MWGFPRAHGASALLRAEARHVPPLLNIHHTKSRQSPWPAGAAQHGRRGDGERMESRERAQGGRRVGSNTVPVGTVRRVPRTPWGPLSGPLGWGEAGPTPARDPARPHHAAPDPAQHRPPAACSLWLVAAARPSRNCGQSRGAYSSWWPLRCQGDGRLAARRGDRRMRAPSAGRVRRGGVARSRRAHPHTRRRCGSDWRQRPERTSQPQPRPRSRSRFRRWSRPEPPPSSASWEPREASAASPARSPSAAERPAPCPRIKVRPHPLRRAFRGGPSLRRRDEAGPGRSGARAASSAHRRFSRGSSCGLVPAGGAGAEELSRPPRRAGSRSQPFSGAGPDVVPLVRGPAPCQRPVGPGRPGGKGLSGAWLSGASLPASSRGRPPRKRSDVPVPPCTCRGLLLLPHPGV